MSREFKVGDKVYLRTGTGPPMVVRTIEGDFIVARWHNKDGDLTSGEFQPAELIHNDDLPSVDDEHPF